MKIKAWKQIVSLVLVAFVGLPLWAAQPGTIELSLRDALLRGLDNNLNLVSARLDPEIAREQVTQAGAAFDPLLFANASKGRSSSQPVDPTQPSGRETFNASVGVSQQLAFGPDWTAVFFTNKSDAPGFNFFNPFFTSGLQVTLDIPLLEGLGREAASQNLILAKAGVEVSRQDLRRQAQDTVQRIENAYWDLVAARGGLDVAKKRLQRAQDLLNLNRKKVEVGTLAPIEITVAEADVASSEEGVIRAENTLADTQDILLQLLAVPRDGEEWDAEIIPSDEPDFERVDFSVDQIFEQALETRPEIYNAKQAIEDQELIVRNARRRLLPTANLNISGTSSGDSLVVETLTNEDFAESVGEIPDVVNYDYSIGLSLSMPIGNKAAKSDYAIADLNLQKARVALEEQELAIRTEVRSAVRGVISGLKSIDAARVTVQLRKKSLEAEQKKMDNGMSTSFQVLEVQNDLANAELSEIQAILDYNKALVTLEKARGTLLTARGLGLD